MWLSKFASGHSAVGITMFHWKKWTSALCPLCLTQDESILHVLCCPHPSQQAIWIEQIANLCIWLSQAQTAPDIIHCLISTLSLCGASTFFQHASPLYHFAAADQDQIGFFGLSVGHLASSWLPLQAAYFTSIGSQKSAMLWAVWLCWQLLQVTHAIWIAWNQQIFEVRQQQETESVHHDILEWVHLATQNLLPVDRFYVTPGPNGFSQARVLGLPLDDQITWLQAVHNAHLCGAEFG